MNTRGCAHSGSKALRSRRGLTEILVQLQCDECCRGIGESVPLSAFPEGDRFRFKGWRSRPQPNSQSREYAEYLQSPEWKAKRLLVLDRDNYTCQRCGGEATDCGHKSYDHFGSEPLTDLQAECKRCNAQERLDRIAGFVAAS